MNIKLWAKEKLKHVGLQRATLIDISLRQLELRVSAPCFLQVGANDGMTGDPFYHSTVRWRGILVEPQPEVFARLRHIRERPGRVICENVAIAAAPGTMRLHKISFCADRWATGLASFDRGVLEAHIESGYVEEMARRTGCSIPKDKQKWLTEIDVECCNAEALLVRNSFARIDALLIDTEGFDADILKSFPWVHYQPVLIVYEHKHLSIIRQSETSAMLKGLGYALVHAGDNTIAILGE